MRRRTDARRGVQPDRALRLGPGSHVRLLTIVGARPQFIKAAVVSLRISGTGIEEHLLHTGQHYDAEMSDTFFDELNIPAPSHVLGVGSGSHGRQTGLMLEGIEKVLVAQTPDAVLVYGDTNSTLAGALAATKLHVPVAHVEAGLRSFNRRMPEEVNRVLTDHMSSILFAPTAKAVDNLSREGIVGDHVRLVGDVMYDLAVLTSERIGDPSERVARFGVQPGKFVLATVHRAENTDNVDRLHAIVDGLDRVSATIVVVLPLHPRTRKTLADAGQLNRVRQLRIVEPLGYGDMAALEMAAAAIATDSGGVQKEAFFHRRPCVTLRDETEWTELVELGWNRLVPPRSAEAVAEGVLGAIGSQGQSAEPYGSPNAGRRIVETLGAL